MSNPIVIGTKGKLISVAKHHLNKIELVKNVKLGLNMANNNQQPSERFSE